MNTHETNQRVVGQDGPADPEMRFAILVQAKIPYNPTAAHQSDCWHVWERWRPRSLEEKPPVIGLEDNGYRLTKHSRELLPLLRTVRRFNADELMRAPVDLAPEFWAAVVSVGSSSCFHNVRHPRFVTPVTYEMYSCLVPPTWTPKGQLDKPPGFFCSEFEPDRFYRSLTKALRAIRRYNQYGLDELAQEPQRDRRHWHVLLALEHDPIDQHLLLNWPGGVSIGLRVYNRARPFHVVDQTWLDQLDLFDVPSDVKERLARE